LIQLSLTSDRKFNWNDPHRVGILSRMPGSSFATGFALCATLIVAIGAQNAFVLRQGLKQEHVTAIVCFCALSDLVLIGVGVAGLARVLGDRQSIRTGLAIAGAAFLLCYGVSALRRARRTGVLHAAAGAGSMPLRVAMLEAMGFTLLNPHVYLDTVLLMGSIGARQPQAARIWFVAGAACASALWFSGLGFGARLLAPIFARPRAWQGLDILVGLTMLILGALLARQALA
jgi:L-lysine exporter family protein LysE/ArgO